MEILHYFSENISKLARQLTPTEIQIADLIRDGKSTKEISSLLNLSTKAIDFHRNNIREKLGLKCSKVSLKSYLASL
jgi:DNA-binding CsgD family transcriptional regulator